METCSALSALHRHPPPHLRHGDVKVRCERVHGGALEAEAHDDAGLEAWQRDAREPLQEVEAREVGQEVEDHVVVDEVARVALEALDVVRREDGARLGRGERRRVRAPVR